MKNGLGNLAVRDAGRLAAIVKNRLKTIQYQSTRTASVKLLIRGVR